MKKNINILFLSAQLEEKDRATTVSAYAVGFKINLLHEPGLQGGLHQLRSRQVDIILLSDQLQDVDLTSALSELAPYRSRIPIILMLPPEGVKNWTPAASEYDAPEVTFKELILSGGLGSMVRLVYERHQMREFLREAEQAAGMGHWEVYTESNQWLESPGISSLFGMSNGKVFNTLEDFMLAVAPEDQQSVAMAFMEGFQEGKPFVVQHKIVPQNASAKEVVLQGKVDRDPTGHIVRLWGTVTEVVPADKPEPQTATAPVFAPPAVVSVSPKPSPVKIPPMEEKVPEPIRDPIVPDPVPQSTSQPVTPIVQSTPSFPEVPDSPSSQEDPSQWVEPPVLTEPLIDLTYLKEVSSGDTVLMCKAIDKFLEATPDVLKQLTRQSRDKDYTQLAKTAHKLKSSVALMGMNAVLDRVKRIEFLARGGEGIETLPVVIHQVQRLIRHANEELAAARREIG